MLIVFPPVDCEGWVCVAAFLQVLWGIVVLKHSFGDDLGTLLITLITSICCTIYICFKNGCNLFYFIFIYFCLTDLPFRHIVHLIGSVVVVLVNSFALMTELIMKMGEFS